MLTAMILATLQVPASPPALPAPTTVTPELVIDLAKVAPGSAISLAAPAVRFDVRLENAAPGGTYRTKVEVAGQPSASTKRIDGAPENMLHPFATREPGCEALQRESQALLRSTNEAEVPGRIASVEKLLGDHVCPPFEPMVRGQMRQTRPRLNTVTFNPLTPDAGVTVTVERLDRTTGAVQKTWRVTSTLKPGTPVPIPPTPSASRAGTSATDPSETRTNPLQTERMVYRSEIRSMLGQRRFKELEDKASALRTGKDRFSSGISKLVDFYEGLVPAGETPSESATMSHERALRAWQTQYSNSITPRNGLIHLERKRAFAARGIEFAPKVTEEGWRGWNEHVKRAWDLVAAAEGIKEKDADFFSLLLDLCQGGDCPVERAEGFLRAGLAIDPSYDHLYVSMANYLLPRWHGSVDAFTRFATRSADESRDSLGEIAYVRIATVALLTEGDAMPQQYPGLSWERIKRGLADLDKRFPNAARTHHLRARFACAYHDRPTATAAFQALAGC